MTEFVPDLARMLAGSDVATWLRTARWGYAFLNGFHILGLALLVGSIVPMDLRLIGITRRPAVPDLARALVPVAAVGLGLAVITGFLLFSVRANEYLGLWIFQLKLGLIAVAGGSALLLHIAHGFLLRTAPAGRLRLAGLLSITCWLTALFAGRMIGFMGD
ncbi:MAG: DUF2214 domain-containing protein [Roseibium sp.]|nr:DUF2214 domain-containing protein [Roseibium sp.]